MVTPLLAVLSAGLAPAWAQGVCPGREDALAALEDSVLTVDLDAVPDRLDEAIASFACGKVATADQLARLWNAEGTYLSIDDDPTAAEESFQAARRVAPDRWTDAFGPDMRAIWSNAPEATERGTIQVDPGLTWWTVWVDGQPKGIPAEVPTGPHVVQGGPSADDVRFGKLVYVRPGGIAIAVHDQQEGAAPAPASPVEEAIAPTDRLPRFTVHTALGAGFALGRAEGAEPAAKLPLALEVTGIGRLPLRAGDDRRLWIRTGVSAWPLMGGAWSFEGQQGAAEVPSALGFQLAAGGRNVQGDVGALVGWQWPGRVQMRILASLELGELPVAIEPRVGLNAGRGAEPAVEVLVAYRPPVIW